MKLQGVFPPAERYKIFLSSYPLKVFFDEENYGYIGRGSVSTLPHCYYLRGRKVSFPIIDIGNFCESASCTILCDGEHQNDRIFNLSMGGVPHLREALRLQGAEEHKCFAKRTLRIGHGTVISMHATVVSGSEIGNGAVIGAGSLISGKVPPYTIAAGNPATIIRSRLLPEQIEIAEELRWWDFDTEFFFRNATLLFDIEKQYPFFKQNARYAENRYRVVVSCRREPLLTASMELSVMGIEDDNGRFTPLSECERHIREYFSQLSYPSDAQLTWVADIFNKNERI